MEPEERRLLERSLKLSEENNRILKKLERKARWAFIWGFIKIAIIVVPLVIGYIYLQPFFEQIVESYKSVKGLINVPLPR